MYVSGYGDASISLAMMEHMFYMEFTIVCEGSAPWPLVPSLVLRSCPGLYVCVGDLHGFTRGERPGLRFIVRPWPLGSVRGAC